MRKSKVLGIAIAAAMVTSIAATAALSASATVSKDGIDGETVGITGSFCNWGNDGDADVPMTNNGGVWEGTIVIDSVTEGMLGDAMTDDGTGAKVPRDDISGKAITFKVRTNGDWTNSWGDYESAYDRTWNSQTDCAVEANVGDSLTITVKLDTTTVVSGTEIPAGDADSWQVWPVTYEVQKTEAPAEESSEEESSEEASTEESSEEASTEATESSTAAESSAATSTAATSTAATSTAATSTATPASTTEDTTTVSTGDATSAAALVAVVIASLGAAVVMTKKASSKD